MNKRQESERTLHTAVVFESADSVELGIAKARLDDAGIGYTVVAEAPVGYGFSPMLIPPSKIQVLETSAAQATELLEDLPDAPKPEAPKNFTSEGDPS